MKQDLSLRLCICLNEVPVGARIKRQEPLPSYQNTYADTPSDRELAQTHMNQIAKYIERNRENDGSNNPTKYINLR